jgi:hypothetical protein
MANSAHVVEVVCRNADDSSIGQAQLLGEFVGKDGLAGPIDAVDRHPNTVCAGGCRYPRCHIVDQREPPGAHRHRWVLLIRRRQLLGVSPFLTSIITGIVLLLAIWVNMRGHGIASALARLRRMSDTKIG